jgi:hypothetical protein
VTVGLPSQDIVELRIVLILDIEVVFILILLLLLGWEGDLATRLSFVQGLGTGSPLDGALSAIIRCADGSLPARDLVIVRFITGPSDAATLLFGRICLLLHLEVPVPD